MQLGFQSYSTILTIEKEKISKGTTRKHEMELASKKMHFSMLRNYHLEMTTNESIFD